MTPPSFQTPRQIFRMYDRGELSREQFRLAMAEHVNGLIEEMEEVHQNPLAAWMEMLKNRRIANRLANNHGEPLVREIFLALSELPGFPLAHWLWNADRPHLPLYCFLRTRREPLFHVIKIATAPFLIRIHIEYGKLEGSRATREVFTLSRDRFGRLEVTGREPL